MDRPPPLEQPHPLHPAPSPVDPSTKKKGCLGCLGITVLVLAILFLVPYLLIFHSPLPVKWLAGEVAENSNLDGSSIDLSGVGGSISKGVTVKEIVVYGAEGDSTVEGFKFHFNGLVDSIWNKRLIIEELSTERAEFVVASSFFEDMTDEEEEEEVSDSGSETDTSKDGEDFLFELQELRFANSHFRSPDGELDIEIPLVRLAGLKIDGESFELEEVEVVSDYIKVELSDASPVIIDGREMPFNKKVSGAFLPGIHEAVIAEIKFSVEFATVGGKTSHRILFFDGAIEQAMLADGVSRVQFKNLSVADYLDCEDLVMPQNFTLMAREQDSAVMLEPGEFTLGTTRFETAAQEVDADAPEEAIIGRAKVGDYEIESKVRPEKDRIWPPISVELTSKPELGPRKLLALVYFQRELSELTEDEKAKVERLHQSQSDPVENSPSE
ncbi:MAG: hypothetical protein P1U85_08905 [Verrucomicrobiales bacterium]|nr:hypothetical protein [Verrucomicrobiales bacterium]